MNTTIKDCIEADKPMRVPLYPDNLKELIEKEVLTENDTNRSTHNSLCDKLDIARHVFTRKSAINRVKEEYDLTSSQIAEYLEKNPKLAEKIKKETEE